MSESVNPQTGFIGNGEIRVYTHGIDRLVFEEAKTIDFGSLLKGLALYQGIVSVAERRERQVVYKRAYQTALEKRKPLLVVGGHRGRHGTGDVCIDTNIKACKGAPVSIPGDIRRIPLPDKWAGAVFASHVLEHLPTVADAEMAIRELFRVADTIYIVSPSKLNMVAWLHPDHHLWVRCIGGRIEIEQR